MRPGRSWVTYLGRTRRRVLLAATEPLLQMGEPLSGGT